jgi:Zn-dependent peptidase ImmA (M78 family)
MSFDLKLFGGKLERCRVNLQLTPKEVSDKTGIEQNRLTQLEKGEIEPTGDEVLIFSDLYKQNYNFFISSQQKFASEQVDILYRKFGNDFSKEDRWAIQEFIFLCEMEDFIFKELGLRTIQFDFTPKGTYFKSHGADAAVSLRAKLGLKDDQVINDPYSIFRQLGIHIFRRKLSNSNISGLFINHPMAGKCVLINYEEDIYRQNFTLAHEVGHTIFDFRDTINISFQKWSKDELKEVRANSFASNFLIPKSLFQKYAATNWIDRQVLDVAKQLQVNPEPLIIAMKEAGVIDKDRYDAFRQLKIPTKDKVDPELKNLSPRYLETKKVLLEKGLSSFYVRNAYECYNRNIISAGRLSEILLSNESELIQLLSLFNLQLSYDY